MNKNISDAQKLLIEIVKEDKDYDFSFIYKLEQAKLKNVKTYLETFKRFEGVEYQIWVIGICIKLLDVLMAETYPNFSAYHINYRNAERFMNLHRLNSTREDYIDLFKKIPSEYYYCKVKNLYYELRKEYTSYWWD